jgi:beta-glucanase (GH16 family)
MSARRVLAGSALALLMPASLLMTTQTGSAADVSQAAGLSAGSATAQARKSVQGDFAKRRMKGQKVTIQALPQIVQQGKGVASASAAKAGITATIKPVKAGRPVVLEVQRGSRWAKVGKTKLTSKGHAEFAATISSGGLPLTYRVVAAKFKGLAKVTSQGVDTSRWLTPTFSDEFSGSALSPAWTHRGQSYEPASLRVCSKGDPSAVRVGGGQVRVSVIKDRTRKTKCKARANGKVIGKFAYRNNGHIGTEHAASIRYGFAAARVKFQKQRGQHGSFWMQPVTTERSGKYPATNGAEIDIIEYFGEPHPNGGITSFIHHKQGNKDIKTGSWIKNSRSFLKNKRDGWSKAFHVFSVEWTPSTYIFRIDGKETWRTNKGVSGVSQFPILSLLASDYELKNAKDGQLPQHMYVDWVRLWQA